MAGQAPPLEHPLRVLSDACASSKVGIVIGLSEQGENENENPTVWYNAALLIDDQGAFRVCYRKVHLWGAYEQQFFKPGDDLQRGTFDFHGVRCEF